MQPVGVDGQRSTEQNEQSCSEMHMPNPWVTKPTLPLPAFCLMLAGKFHNIY